MGGLAGPPGGLAPHLSRSCHTAGFIWKYYKLKCVTLEDSAFFSLDLSHHQDGDGSSVGRIYSGAEKM